MPATNPAPPSTRPASLPDGWIGTWQGDVQVVVPGDQVTGAFTMTLEITPAADQPAPVEDLLDGHLIDPVGRLVDGLDHQRRRVAVLGRLLWIGQLDGGDEPIAEHLGESAFE